MTHIFPRLASVWLCELRGFLLWATKHLRLPCRFPGSSHTVTITAAAAGQTALSIQWQKVGRKPPRGGRAESFLHDYFNLCNYFYSLRLRNAGLSQDSLETFSVYSSVAEMKSTIILRHVVWRQSSNGMLPRDWPTRPSSLSSRAVLEWTCVPSVTLDVISDPDGCLHGSQVREGGNHMFAVQEQEVAFVSLLIALPPLPHLPPPPTPPSPRAGSVFIEGLRMPPADRMNPPQLLTAGRIPQPRGPKQKKDIKSNLTLKSP